MKLFAALLIALAVSAGSASAADLLDEHDAAGTLREFVTAYLARHSDTSFPADRTISVAIAKTSLGPQDPDAYVIYIKSGGWCGSGGCHTLVVTKVDGRFQPLGLVPATEPPILAERPRGAADAEIIVSTRNAAAKLTRRGDSYDFYTGQTPVGADGTLDPLISNETPMVKLY